MRPRILVLLAALAIAVPAYAEGPHGHQRDPGTSGHQPAPPPRAEQPHPTTPPPPPAPAPAPVPAPARVPAPAPLVAVPRTALLPPITQPAAAPIIRTYPQRQRDPGVDTRQAVPVPPRYSTHDDHDGHGYIPPPRRYYNYNYYYYPRYAYPYGYGGFGLGYFYYDPYIWGPTYAPYDPSYYGGYYGGGYYGGGYYGGGGSVGGSVAPYHATGELRLEIKQRNAQVYVDGYYAGIVDDFDGAFQSLTLEEGPHTIRIVQQGYEPLEFSVRIFAGRKMTYRGDLNSRRP
jgi:hypothetical protein